MKTQPKQSLRLLTRLRRKSGFSFVELIAVLIIIAILAAIGVPVYLEQVKNARAADAQTTIGAVKTASKMYRQKFGELPRDVAELKKRGFLQVDRVTERSWKFEFTKSRDQIEIIKAISTEHMPGGAGHAIEYNAETGEWSGYGQAKD